MNIGSIKEKNPEKRISITPDTAKSFKNLGLNIFIEKGYGESLGYSDKDYKDNGAEILNNSNEVLSKSNLICKVSFPTEKEFSLIKENSHLIVSNYNPEKEKQFRVVLSYDVQKTFIVDAKNEEEAYDKAYDNWEGEDDDNWEYRDHIETEEI